MNSKEWQEFVHNRGKVEGTEKLLHWLKNIYNTRDQG